MGKSIIQNKTRTLVQYSSVSLDNNAQAQSSLVIPTLADVIGIDWDLTVNAAGTLVGAKTVENAIQRMVISDRNGKPVMDVAGSDLPLLSLLLSPNGSYSTPDTATQNTDKYYRDVLGITAVLANQPLSIQITFAPYSALATSGATGAIVNLTINIWYGSNLGDATTRIYKRTMSVVSGDNFVGKNLVNGVNTHILAFKIGSESNLSSVTFSSNGDMDDFSRLLPQQIINLENDIYRDKHQTGIFKLFVEPFKVETQNTRLDFSSTGSDTVSVYQIANN
ncbi:hypothetical protein J4226_00230 [Candidatus Pacearchaeota archaeon]|nr:hypothetical protein [Candidatus Pacearchaeota archaeon]